MAATKEPAAFSARAAISAKSILLYILTLGLYEFWRRRQVITITQDRLQISRGVFHPATASIPLQAVEKIYWRTDGGLSFLDFWGFVPRPEDPNLPRLASVEFGPLRNPQAEQLVDAVAAAA